MLRLGVQVCLIGVLQLLSGAFVSGQVIFFSVVLGAGAMGVGSKVTVFGGYLLRFVHNQLNSTRVAVFVGSGSLVRSYRRSAGSAWQDAGFASKAGAGMHSAQLPARNPSGLRTGQRLRPIPQLAISCPQLRGHVHHAPRFPGSVHYRRAWTARLSRPVSALGLYSRSADGDGYSHCRGSRWGHETTGRRQ